MLERTRYSADGCDLPVIMYLIRRSNRSIRADHPYLVEGIRQFENLLIETEDRSSSARVSLSGTRPSALTPWRIESKPRCGDQETMTRSADGC